MKIIPVKSMAVPFQERFQDYLSGFMGRLEERRKKDERVSCMEKEEKRYEEKEDE